VLDITHGSCWVAGQQQLGMVPATWDSACVSHAEESVTSACKTREKAPSLYTYRVWSSWRHPAFICRNEGDNCLWTREFECRCTSGTLPCREPSP